MNYLFDKKELKIGIESLSICGGNCNGCFLTPQMRANAGFWNEEQFDKVFLFLNYFINYHKKNNGVDEIGLTFGQGDHLLLDKNNLDFLFQKIKNNFDSKPFVFLTASGITNRKYLVRNIDYLYETSIKNNQSLIFDLVINSTKLTDSFIDIYEENINYIVKIFGAFDLNLNMGQDIIDNISPQKLNDFLLVNNIKFITLNYNPITKNYNHDTFKKILNWLEEFAEISSCHSYIPNYLISIKRLIQSFKNNELSSMDYLIGLKNNLLKGIYIDFYGNLFLQQEGIGDNPLTDRSGYKAIINIFETKLTSSEIMKEVISYIDNHVKQSYSNMLKNKKCNICDYQKVCLNGFSNIIKKISLPKSDMLTDCDYGLKLFFEKIEQHKFKDKIEQYPIFFQRNLNLNNMNTINKTHDFEFYEKLSLLNLKNKV